MGPNHSLGIGCEITEVESDHKNSRTLSHHANSILKSTTFVSHRKPQTPFSHVESTLPIAKMAIKPVVGVRIYLLEPNG